MIEMTVRYRREIILPHAAIYTCGGVTGHAKECIRSICREIVHNNCSPTDIHTTRPLKDR